MMWETLPYLTLTKTDPKELEDVGYPAGSNLPEPPLLFRLVNNGAPNILDSSIIGHHCWTRILHVDAQRKAKWDDSPSPADWDRGTLYVLAYPLTVISDSFDSDAAIIIHWSEPPYRNPKCRCRTIPIERFAHRPDGTVYERKGRGRGFTKADRKAHRDFHRLTPAQIVDNDPSDKTPPFIFMPVDPFERT